MKNARIYFRLHHIYSTKKLRISQKTMEQKNTKANNYSIYIHLFRYIPSVEKDASFSLQALKPLLWHCVKWPVGQSYFSQKRVNRVF